ncbi:MAG: SurA N-terminal domain-containing protein [Bacteroidales bacterium]|jgi:peptidyl-prolyl cis-trans isomerase D|nr:SurA N-terminal domain-containing protein [Bacteroidales bacterium]
MAAIGAIRKHGVLLMVIIGIALLAFLLGDFNKLSSYFSDQYTMGKVDGTKIDVLYRTQYEENTDLWKIFYEKANLDETEMYQVHEMTWSNLVNEMVLDKQLKALGLEFTDEMKESATADMVASLRTQQPNQLLAKLVEVLVKQVGPENAMAVISNIEEYKNQEGAQGIYRAYKAAERFNWNEKKQTGYFALVQGSLYFSDESAKKLQKDNQSAMIKLLTIPITAPAFAELKAPVTDKEMKEYYNQHKEKYRFKENMRDIDVAVFPVSPTPQDMQTIEDSVKSAYARFLQTPSIAEFNITESFPPLDSTFVSLADITEDFFDSIIFKRPVGSMIEPFIYQNSLWYYGKVYGANMHPDSILVGLLVLDYKTSQNATSIRTRKQAKAECDSLAQLINSNQASIFALMPNYLGGRKATDTTAWYAEQSTPHNMYRPLINTAIGGTYIYDAQGAYVVFQVLAKTAAVEKRLYTLYPYEIKPSDATIKNIKAQASQLMSSSNNIDLFTENAAKQGIQVVQGVDVTSMASAIGQLPNCRDIISWAFNDETKKGSISDIYNLNNTQMYAVAVLKTIKEKGIPKFEVVKSTIETELANKKKVELVAEQVKKELASNKDYPALAQKWGARFQDSTNISFIGEIYQNAGVENIAIGRIFSMPTTAQDAVIAGKTAVYAVSIYNVNPPAVDAPITSEKMTLRNMVLGRARNEMTIFEELKDKSNILDRRYFFYQK